MNKRFFLVILPLIVCLACTYDIISNRRNTVNIERNNQEKHTIVDLHLINQYVTGDNDFFKTPNSYPIDIYLYKNMLYLLSDSDNKLIMVDNDNGTTITNNIINDIIKEGSNLHFGIKQVVVIDDYIFLRFLRAIYCITSKGKFINKYVYRENTNFFAVNKNKSIIIFFDKSINQYSFDGTRIDSFEIEHKLTGHYCRVKDNVYIADGNLLYTYKLTTKKIKRHIIKNSITDFNNYYFSFELDNQTVWYNYIFRNQIIILDKNSDVLVRMISFNSNVVKLTTEEIQAEEGIPNFKILPNNMGGLFIVSLNKKVLEIYKSNSLGLTLQPTKKKTNKVP